MYYVPINRSCQSIGKPRTCAALCFVSALVLGKVEQIGQQHPRKGGFFLFFLFLSSLTLPLLKTDDALSTLMLRKAFELLRSGKPYHFTFANKLNEATHPLRPPELLQEETWRLSCSSPIRLEKVDVLAHGALPDCLPVSTIPQSRAVRLCALGWEDAWQKA